MCNHCQILLPLLGVEHRSIRDVDEALTGGHKPVQGTTHRDVELGKSVGQVDAPGHPTLDVHYTARYGTVMEYSILLCIIFPREKSEIYILILEEHRTYHHGIFYCGLWNILPIVYGIPNFFAAQSIYFRHYQFTCQK